MHNDYFRKHKCNTLQNIFFLVPRVESLTAEPSRDAVEYGQSLSLTCVVSGSDSEVSLAQFGR